MTEQKERRTPPGRGSGWARFDPEAVLLLLLGLATFFYGTQALLRWALAGWQSGKAVAPMAVMAVAVILPVAFLLLIRRRGGAGRRHALVGSGGVLSGGARLRAACGVVRLKR